MDTTNYGKRAVKAEKLDWLGTSGREEPYLVSSWVLFYIPFTPKAGC